MRRSTACSARCRQPESERNIVVEIAETATLGWLAAGRLRRGALLRTRRCLVVATAGVLPTHRRVTARGTSAEHLHLVGADLGGVAVLAFLVLPLARLQTALDVDLTALAQVLRGDLGQPPEHHHVVPFGRLAALAAGLVLPGVGGRDAQIAQGVAAGHVARFRIAPQVA